MKIFSPQRTFQTNQNSFSKLFEYFCSKQPGNSVFIVNAFL